MLTLFRRNFCVRILWSGWLLSVGQCWPLPPQAEILQILSSYNSNKSNETISLCKKLIRTAPDQVEGYEKLVKASRQDLSSAISYFRTLPPENPRSAYGLGLAFKEKKDYSESLVNFKKAALLDPQFQQPFLELAEVYAAEKKQDEGERFFTDLIRRNSRHANAHLGLGDLYRLTDRDERALKHLNKASELDPRNLSVYGVKRTIYWKAERVKDFIRACLAIDGLASEMGQYELQYKNYRALGSAYKLLANYSKAIEYYEQSLTLARQVGDLTTEADVLYGLGNVNYHLDNLQVALEDHEKANHLSKVLKYTSLQAWSLLRIGEINYRLANFASAYENYIEALDLHKQIKDVQGICYSYKNIGDMHRIFGEYDKALDYYQKTLGYVKPKDLEEVIYIALGDVYRDQGDFNLALDYYQKVLGLREKSQHKGNLDRAIGRIGEVHLKRGELKKAMQYLIKAVSASNAIGNKLAVGFWLESLGHVYLKLDRLDQARRYYSEALSIGEKLRYGDLLYEAYYGLARLSVAERNQVRAYDCYKRAIEALESIRNSLVLEREKVGFVEDKGKVYEDLIHLLVKMERSEESFQYVERAKAFALRQVLPQSELIRMLQAESSDLKNELLHMDAKLEAHHRRLLEENRKLGAYANMKSTTGRELSSKVADLQIQIDKLESQRTTYLEKLREKFPQLRNVTQPDILGPRQVQLLLEPKEHALRYFVGEERTTVYVVGQRTFAVKELPISRSDLRSKLEAVSSIFSHRNSLSREWEEFRIDVLQELYTSIFEPITSYINFGGPLIILPDDVLNLLPFEMLVVSMKDRIKFLVEDHPISYAYSGSLLKPIKSKLGSTDTKARLDLLAVGNPVFGSYKSSTGDSLQEIPYTEKELASISIYGKKKRVLRRFDATEHAFKKAAGQARIIHLATHGFLDSANPLYSRLVFSLDPKIAQDGEDGFLHTYEICNLRLNADLVVLSACQTAAGKVRKGEGLEAMSRSFLYAGARSILASLWPIADAEATPELMAQFYQNVASGMRKPEALQKAKLTLMRTEKYDDPYFWAPFVLMGDPASIGLQIPNTIMPTLVAIGLILIVGLFGLAAYWKTSRLN